MPEARGEERASRKPRRRRRVWFVGITTVILTLVVALGLVTLVSPIRESFLRHVLELASGALPGELRVRRAGWPHLGSLVLDGVEWTHEGKVLLHTDTLSVDFSLGALRHRDLLIQDARIQGLHLNVPALVGAFAASSDASGENGEPASFPRPGALPGLPSLALQHLSLQADSIRITPSQAVQAVHLEAGLDMRFQQPPRIRVARLHAVDPTGTWQVDTLALDVNLHEGRASGHGRGRVHPLWPLFFDLHTSAADQFVLHVAASAEQRPPAAAGMLARLQVIRDGLDVDSLRVQALVRTPGTVELERHPALVARLSSLRPLAGIVLNLQGVLGFRPDPSMRLRAELQPDSLFRAGVLAFERSHRTWTLNIRDFDAADLSMSGRVRSQSDSLHVAASIGIAGPRWRELLRRPLGLPEDLRLQARLDLHWAHDSDRAQVHLAAQGGTRSMEIDSLLLQGNVGLRGSVPSRLRLRLRRGLLQAGLGAELAWGPEIRLRSSALILDDQRPDASRLQELSDTPTLRYDRERRRLRLEAWRIEGAAGRMRLQGEAVLGDSGSASVQLDWPRYPSLLVDLMALPAAQRESLRASWNRDGPYEVEIRGRFTDGGKSSRASARFRLPGPRALAPLIPIRLQGLDEGPLLGSARFESTPRRDGTFYRATLEASRTAWLDSLRLQVQGTPRDLRLDEALLRLRDARLAVAGSLGRSQLDLQATLDVPNETFLQRLASRRRSSAAAETTAASDLPALRLQGEASITGSRAAPRLHAQLDGDLAWKEISVPRWSASVQIDSVTTTVRFDARQGLQVALLHLESFQSRLAIPREAGTTQELWLRAQGPGLELEQSARIRSDSTWSAEVSSLHLSLGGQDLSSQAPFQLAWGPTGLRLRDVRLQGTLGRIEASGVASAASTALEATILVDLPEKPAALHLPADLWPRTVDAELRAAGSDSLTLRGEVRGFRLAGGTQPPLQLQVAATSRGTRAEIVLGEEDSPLLQGDLQGPLRLRLYPPSTRVEPGPVSADLSFSGLPFTVRTSRSAAQPGPEDILHLGGRLLLGGTTAAPSGFARVEATFPDTPHLSEYQLQAVARLGENGRVDSLWNASTWDAAGPANPSGLQSHFRVLNASETVLTGRFAAPFSTSLLGQSLQFQMGEEIEARIQADAVSLSSSNPFLPPGASLAGTLQLALDLRGERRNPSLQGHLRTSKVELMLRDGSNVTWQASNELGGRLRAPRMTGRIDVVSGVIKVPEAQKNLHPVAGESLLLDSKAPAIAPDDSLASTHDAADSLHAAGSGATEGREAPPQDVSSQALAQADLDVEIRIPGGLFVRGRGLDLELAGQLRIQQQEGNPRVVGELNVVRGTYSLLGRTFNLDRGKVLFRGDETNPELDIQLSTTVSGTRIRVLVNGTTEKPQLTLSSDPEMEQTDIIALLTIGKTFDELSDEESSLLRDRAAAVFLSMGAAAIQENVANDLGIDVVQFRSNSAGPADSSSRSSDAGSLAFGKYLNPRLLLSYAYSLDRNLDDVVSLEYFLRGELRIETLYSVGGQTGMGFAWTKEY